VQNRVPSHIQRKKFGELWSTNHGDLALQLYLQNQLFAKGIFWPLEGAATQNFYPHHRMASLTNPYPTRDGGSLNHFFQWGVKNWLKI